MAQQARWSKLNDATSYARPSSLPAFPDRELFGTSICERQGGRHIRHDSNCP